MDDGCHYMSEEEVRELMTRAAPGVFDRESAKNKILDVRYGTLDTQLLDIYYPDGDANAGPGYPVIFFIHGGGWTMGSRYSGTVNGIFDATNHGYAVVAVEYRLYPEAKFPEFIFDIKTAVRWARAHAARYRFDPDRFGMIGDSAGAYNALMTAFTANRPEYEGAEYGWEEFSSSLNVVCAQYGTTDLSVDKSDDYRVSGVKRIAREVPGAPSLYDLIWCADNPGILRLCSPISFVSKDIPPVLLMHGKMDGVVPYQNSTRLAEKIEKVCGKDRVRLLLFEDLNHSDSFFSSPENAALVIDFFDRYLK
jgi:acetyl esterase/lipase